MRTEEMQSEWEAASGYWRQRSLREDQQAAAMDATKSANPFSYWGEPKAGEKVALAVTGYWFWTNYAFEAAVRGEAESVIGLAVCYQDPANYLAVRWTSKLASAAADRLELVAVRGGKEQVLSSGAGGFLPGQWYALRLGYCDGYLLAWVDGTVRAAAQTDLFGAGQAALLAGGQGAFFDDVRIGDWEFLRDDFEALTAGKWELRGGKWQASGGALAVSGRGEALAITGSPQWASYRASVSFKGSASGCGLVVGVDGPAPVAAFVERQGKAQRLVLATRPPSGPGRELAAAPLRPSTGWRQLEVMVEEGLVVAAAEGVSVRGFVPGAKGGRLALWAREAQGLLWDRIAVDFLPPLPTVHLVKEFSDVSQHFEMAEWGSTRHAWTPGAPDWPAPVPELASNRWWSKGDYFHAYLVKLPLAGIGTHDFSVALVLDAEPGWEGTGVTIKVAGKQGEKALSVSVLSGGTVTAEKQVPVAEDQVTVTCRRSEELLVVMVGEEVVYSGPLVPPPGAPVKQARPPAGGEEK
jgi:hypothetical protein